MTTSDAQPATGLFKDVVASIKGRPRDYTTGSVGRAIVCLAIPMVIEMLGQALFGLADVIFVTFLGTTQVAVVSLTEAVLMIVFAVAIGFSMGTTAMVARRIGEKNPEAASSAALQAIFIGVGISVVVAIVGIAGSSFFLRAMGATPDVVEQGSLYFSIVFGGNVTIVLLFLINAIFRGAGDPSQAMRALWLANGINIVLDPLLIFGLGPIPALGLEGAAIATTIGRGVGVLYQLRLLTSGGSKIRVHLSDLRIDPAVMSRIVKISAIGVVQFFISTASFMFLTRIQSRFGEAALAAHTIALRLITFVLLPVWGVGNAAATLVGQNLGAGNPDRAEKSGGVTGFVNMCVLGAVGLLFIFGAEQLVGFMFPATEEVIAMAAGFLRIMAYSYLFWAYGMTTVMAFNGSGDTTTPTWINFFVYWVLQLPLAWALAVPLGFGADGVFIAVAICQVVLAIVGVLMFRRGTWKSRAI
jgi:putative MATE family efflux protein